MKKLFRISTVPMSLNLLLKGQLRYLNQFYDVTAISGSGSDLEEVREREGVKVEAIEMSREISILKDLVALFQLYRFFKKEKPDIVHSITPKAGLLSMMAARLAGVPVRMHTFTGLIFPYKKGLLKTVLIQMDRLLANSATYIYPEGKGVENDLKHYQITRKPMRVLANGNVNGIDHSHFNPDLITSAEQQKLRTELGISKHDYVFIFVGRLVRDKGINELIVAFKNLCAQIAQQNLDAITSTQNPQPITLKLLLVGPIEQDLDPLTSETLSEIKNNPHIISVGFQQEVRPYFSISNTLVFPSYREGFPNVVLQSLAMGLPAIVTNINGCNEIITHRQNGLIIPVKDNQALHHAMEQLIVDTNLYTHLKSKTRPSILPYQQKEVWEALLQEYRGATSTSESIKKNKQ